MGSPPPVGASLLTSYYADMKARAKSRGIGWALSKEQFKDTVLQHCFYCDQPPTQVYKKKRYRGEFLHSGIDRIDSSLPYEFENVVACCSVCNVMKNTLSPALFFHKIKRIFTKHENTEYFRTEVQLEVYRSFQKRIMRKL